MNTDILQNNLAQLNDRIEQAVARSGRRNEDVKLVAVTKYVDSSVTRAIVDAGQLVLGESRPQVLWDKAESDALTGLEIEWHLIGHLQRNKINRSLKYCSLIHSVDSLRLLNAINTSSTKLETVTDCLLEINISGEPAKHGFQPAEIEAALVAAAEFTHVRIKGFMGMASLGGSDDSNRAEFANLRSMLKRFESFQCDNIELVHLSMGMSTDFEIAIEEGATLVRIGSMLFDGLRP